jgi:hypothetical protein
MMKNKNCDERNIPCKLHNGTALVNIDAWCMHKRYTKKNSPRIIPFFSSCKRLKYRGQRLHIDMICMGDWGNGILWL